MVEKTGYMFITGPEVIKAVTRESVTKEELGGAMAHNARSGVAHFSAPNYPSCLHKVRDLLSFLPQYNLAGFIGSAAAAGMFIAMFQ